jgi:transcriptional regulator with XRE-family HTH domain
MPSPRNTQDHRKLWQPGINGDVLREARLKQGWSQRDLAAKAKALGTPVDDSNISKAERTGKGLGMEKILVLLQLLPRVKPARLIQGYGPRHEALLEGLRARQAASETAARAPRKEAAA